MRLTAGAIFIPKHSKDEQFLTDLGIADDIADQIITQAATEVKAAADETAGIQAQLEEANKQIAGFREMNIDSIRAAAEDWKTKYEAAEADKTAMQHKHRLEGYVKGLGLRDDVYEAHVTKQLTDAGLQFDDAGKLIGGDDIVSKFRESHPGAFLDTKPEARVVASTMHHEPAANSVEAAFYAKNPGLAPRD